MIQTLCINPVQAHNALLTLVWPWVKANTAAGHKVAVEARLAEDAKSDQQRRYLHGVVLTQIARQATVNGQKFPMPVFKEFFRDKYLGFKTVTFVNPMTGKRHRRRVRVSTEDLGVKKYAEYIERVTSFAVTELSVVFDQHSPDGAVDPDTGEVYEV